MSNLKKIFQISKANRSVLFLVCGLVFSLIFAILAIVIVLNIAAKIDSRIDSRIDSLLVKVNDIDSNVTTKLNDFNNINDKIENLSKKIDMQEQDIFYIQDSITDNKFNDLSISINNLITMVENQEIEMSSLKETQRAQQNKLNSLDQFKKSLIDKVTSMLFNYNNSDKKKENRSKVIFNKYILNSIEYRSNELWAVFLPKNAKSLSELKFVTVGDLIDEWLVVSINDKSVVLQKNNDKYKVELNEK